MDVRLPDGTVIKNVPDGTTRAELTEKLKANGYDTSKLQATPEEPGFGDRMARFGLAGAKGMVQGGPLGGLLAAAGESNRQVGELTERAAYGAGGKVTDALSGKVEPETAARAGFAANVATQAVPMVLGGQIAKVAAGTMQAGAKGLMQSALKPTIADLKTGKASKAIDTLLEEGINPTKGGVEKLKGMVDDLSDEIAQTIANSPATVNKADVGKRLQATLDEFKKQVNPQADVEAIRKAWLEFRNHPLLAGKTDIPVQLAQEMKQGTYKQLSKKYGQMGSADVEAQKALARGLKEEISTAVPEVAGLNAKQSDLLNALKVSERRALMDANKNPMGLALLAQNPMTWAAFMADKSALFKSLVARIMYSGAEQIPSTAGKVLGGLYGARSGMSPEDPSGDLYK